MNELEVIDNAIKCMQSDKSRELLESTFKKDHRKALEKYQKSLEIKRQLLLGKHKLELRTIDEEIRRTKWLMNPTNKTDELEMYAGCDGMLELHYFYAPLKFNYHRYKFLIDVDV